MSDYVSDRERYRGRGTRTTRSERHEREAERIERDEPAQMDVERRQRGAGRSARGFTGHVETDGERQQQHVLHSRIPVPVNPRRLGRRIQERDLSDIDLASRIEEIQESLARQNAYMALQLAATIMPSTSTFDDSTQSDAFYRDENYTLFNPNLLDNSVLDLTDVASSHDSHQCVICIENIACIANDLCGHALCATCTKTVLKSATNICPMCRGPFGNALRFGVSDHCEHCQNDSNLIRMAECGHAVSVGCFEASRQDNGHVCVECGLPSVHTTKIFF